jgi:transcription termination factor Rho
MTNLEALLAELREKAAGFAKAEEAPAAEAVVAKAAEPEAAPAEAAVADADAEETVAKAGAAPVAAEEPAAGSEGVDTDEGDEAHVAKAMTVTDADGNERVAIDGFALIKSLQDDVAALRDDNVALRAELDALKAVEPPQAAPAVADEALAKSFADHQAATTQHTETLAKSLAAALDALGAAQAEGKAAAERAAATEAALGEHATLIKSLQADLKAFGETGSGRRSAVVLHEKSSPLPVAAPAAPSIGDVFAKAQRLNAEGKINSLDVARICAWANSGQGLPPEFGHLFAPGAA